MNIEDKLVILNNSYKLHTDIPVCSLYNDLYNAVIHDIFSIEQPNKYMYVLIFSRLLLKDKNTTLGCVKYYYSNKENDIADKDDNKQTLLKMSECKSVFKNLHINNKNLSCLSEILPNNIKDIIKYDTVEDYRLNNPKKNILYTSDQYKCIKNNISVLDKCCVCHLYCLHKVLNGEMYLKHSKQ